MTHESQVPVSGWIRWLIGVRRRTVNVTLDTKSWAARRSAVLRAKAQPVTEVTSPVARWLVVLTICAGIGALWLGWLELAVASTFLFGLLVLAVVFIVGSHRLEARLDLNRVRVVVGERAHGRLILTNPSARPTLPLTIELPVGKGSADFDLPALAKQSEHEDLFVIPTSRRAVIPVGPVTAVRTDPLALLRREQHLTEAELLYVHPRTVPLDGSASGMIRDLEGQTVRKLTDSDISFHALRDYVSGDDRRHIHWKTTARTGQLMVRQFEETRRSHLLVALSTRLDDYATEDEFETAISIAGSLGVQTLVDGQTLSVATSTRQLRPGTGRTLLDQLSALGFERQSPRLPEVARRLSREIHGASVAVIVCGSLVQASEFRRVRRHLPTEVRTIVTRSETATETTVRPYGDLHVATIGRLDDLPTAIRRLAT